MAEVRDDGGVFKVNYFITAFNWHLHIKPKFSKLQRFVGDTISGRPTSLIKTSMTNVAKQHHTSVGHCPMRCHDNKIYDLTKVSKVEQNQLSNVSSQLSIKPKNNVLLNHLNSQIIETHQKNKINETKINNNQNININQVNQINTSNNYSFNSNTY